MHLHEWQQSGEYQHQAHGKQNPKNNFWRMMQLAYSAEEIIGSNTVIPAKEVERAHPFMDFTRYDQKKNDTGYQSKAIRIHLRKEMGGDFSRIQQSEWNRQALRDLAQAGAKIAIVTETEEDRQWMADLVEGMSFESS